jgi:hypothetical protein
MWRLTTFDISGCTTMNSVSRTRVKIEKEQHLTVPGSKEIGTNITTNITTILTMSQAQPFVISLHF